MLTRRTVLRSLPAVAALPHAIYGHAAASKSSMRLLIGTGTGQKSTSKGIYAADWNPATGEVGEITLVAEADSPTWLALSPKAPHVYTVAESHASMVFAYDIKHDAKGAITLTRINDQSSRGGGPTHISVNHDGKSAFVANYGGGSLTSYKILPDGSLSEPVSHFQTTPVDDAPEHAKPHIHESTPTPDGRHLLVNDLGSDRIWIYTIDPDTAVLTPATQPFWQGRNKSGPRHMTFHPNNRWVYSVNELDSTIDHLLWDAKAGTLTTIGNFVSTLNPDFPRNTAFASEVLTSPDGRFVYAGNRRDETIAMFTVDPKSGDITLAQVIAHGGVTARHVTLDPSGKFLLVACQDSGAVVVMGRDTATGKLSNPLHTYPLGSPQCLVFTT
ncbi:lactonase family protein [Granulicella sibirica]|uniref:6-phosphogluconolactonase n=1 Tax=Granulicella sibirica TaxID=2479048 RepID=A0A4V1L5E9_9BACT|nr:lactonase family protein [Granulicella sibirica]RXH55524.1 6-phosphogluconolactonase [Granulicella sibirica]